MGFCSLMVATMAAWLWDLLSSAYLRFTMVDLEHLTADVN